MAASSDDPSRGASLGEHSWFGSCKMWLRVFVLGSLTVAAIYGLVLNKVVDQCRVCTSKRCNEAAEEMYQSLDLNVDPCQDFYRFACGGFLNNAVIPQDEGMWINSASNVGVQLLEQGRQLLEEAASKEPFETDAKAKDYYKACTDNNTIEGLGIAPMMDVFQRMGGWPVLQGERWNRSSVDGWEDLVYSSTALGLDTEYLFRLFVPVDPLNVTTRVLVLEQPRQFDLLREDLIQGVDGDNVKHYLSYMIGSARLFGARDGKAVEELRQALNFEIELAKRSSSIEERLNAGNLYNPTTIGEFEGPYGYKSIKRFVNHVLREGGSSNTTVGDDEKVVVKDVEYLKAVFKLLSITDIRVVANYVGWRVLSSKMGFLHAKARRLKYDFEKLTKGEGEPETWKRCLVSIGFNRYPGESMHGAVSSMYVRKYFKEYQKAAIDQLVDEFRSTFEDVLKDIKWLEESTKQYALRKLTRMGQFVGYPEELIDRGKVDGYFQGLETHPDKHLENSLAVMKFNRQKEYQLLKADVDIHHWTDFANVAIVNAIYEYKSNSMLLPAGILQGLFYDSNLPQYLNYAAIGSIIGHEIIHGFDYFGRQWTEDGGIGNWWDERSLSNFLQNAQCFIDQYSEYNATQVGLKVNGTTTISENMADNGGIRLAYRAYENWLARNGEEAKLDHLEPHSTPKQLFWIRYAQVYCTKYKDEALRNRVRSGSYAPAEFRVLGSLTNNKEFAGDFGCRDGTPMNPSGKCIAW